MHQHRLHTRLSLNKSTTACQKSGVSGRTVSFIPSRPYRLSSRPKTACLTSCSGGDALLVALLNGRQPVLESVHVAWRSAFAFPILPFHFFPDGKIHSPIVISLWQSNGTVEKSSG